MALLHISLRALRRNPVRFALTVLALAATMAIVAFVAFLLRSFNESAPSRELVMTRHRYSWFGALPARYLDKIAALPGVQATTPSIWVDGKFEAKPDISGDFIGVDPGRYVQVEPELGVTPEVAAAWREDRQSLIMDDEILAELGAKVGDRVGVSSALFPAPSGEPWLFTIRGTYHVPKGVAFGRRRILLNWGYINDNLAEDRRGGVMSIATRPQPGTSVSELARRIDGAFADADVPTKSEDLDAVFRSAASGYAPFLRLFSVIALIVAAIGALIVANTVALSARERIKEFAVLRALGFPNGAIVWALVVEVAVLGLSGTIAGVGAGYGLARLVADAIDRQFDLTAGLLLPIFVGSLLVSCLIGVLTGLSGVRPPVTTALRHTG